ncbi:MULTISPECIES: TauD/TfdA family dioxygenase [unclassified Pseudofrankia]|uniref:TauD/TfdA family dioxygenase n=1 Tax=unclassified Pseudofrankia TaxID=2994372 RepID=UPI0008D91D24|nr:MULTISPECIES: TauD/TfdA family dioxygenase [unclassified Pseudofrankia]MDT3440246.1 TauD/TfdA family dioxygenase [Pseudofrankia sp. BMG5.37]OHV73526.1 hypothetical protein BCD48_33360 [Pseudofrankia sp. BMG5.36]
MSLDLTEFARACAVSPTRTADPAHARDLLDRDGAAILTDLGTDRETAAGLAAAVLGDRFVAAGIPIEVTDAGGKDPRRHADLARRMLPLHTDGFAYGAHAPDVFFLLCATPSDGDGLSFLVDQEALLTQLERSPRGAELATFARTHVVDQSEPGGHPTLGPLALPLPSGRRAVRRSIDVRPADDDPDPAYTSRMLTLWGGLLDAIGGLAPRFAVGAGEALAIDNTRIAHGRDAYTTPDRLLWRAWAWTDQAGGVPEGELWSDTRMVLIAA